MTYNVFDGTLDLAQSINQPLLQLFILLLLDYNSESNKYFCTSVIMLKKLIFRRKTARRSKLLKLILHDDLL